MYMPKKMASTKLGFALPFFVKFENVELPTIKSMVETGKNFKEFTIELNALLYNYPVEYFKKLISGENVNFQSQKLSQET